MELKRMYRSELLAAWDKFQRSQLLFPFYDSHSQARTGFLSAVKRGNGYFIERKAQWLLVEKVDEGGTWRINNLLISTDIGWRTAFLLLENAARQKFKRALQLKLKANFILQQWLIAQGYQFLDGIWQKELVYHTGLVLGGGGARGAYQIGVWKALLEKNIQFEVITGTSVGGLNGALITQGDYNQALALWEEIETDKVLDITFKEVEEIDFAAQVDQLRTFLRTSLQQRGVSSKPLRRLLEERLDVQKIQNGCPLYVVTTKVPAFQEVIVPLNECRKEEIIEWLLASAAFFPMMAMTRIKGENYVDGGYRNNLPVDITLQMPITELIVVDVHGPGLDKKYRLPDEVTELVLASPWNLGDLLLFQSGRSSENIDLGYLETKRIFGELQGYRYFFSCRADFESLTKHFFVYLRDKLKINMSSLYPELRRFFRQSVPVEILSLAFLEFFAYWVNVSPVKVFTPEEFIETILKHFEMPIKLDANFSVQEQIEDFIENHNVFSNYYLVLQIYQLEGSLEAAYRRWPIPTLLALFFRYIHNEK
ncbi:MULTISPECIES: patatin-like phospholipase family protein [Enterococcus]|uniref:Patatin-like phospholipase family protein n=1 Tax=Candidatus Enterococcus murrayae TaxID=2815321 RepID=A0ABS3HK30_9ENTE|nr:patatin-like phospholipase family protein [Enterococcus sp. MJM16]MBO0453822.1 patatin-like phospholipase family protein [Enterococcus sp. MJM16]